MCCSYAHILSYLDGTVDSEALKFSHLKLCTQIQIRSQLQVNIHIMCVSCWCVPATATTF